MIEENTSTKNYERFRKGQDYLRKKGLSELIPLCVDFLEGKQWAKINKDTAFIPRPVVNICSKIVDNKLSNILGSPVKLNFKADFDEQSTEKFTKFASYQSKEMQQEWYDYLACKDGLVKGTYNYYYYWDENAVGRQAIAKGGLRCEIIDPLDIVFENPRETDCQKQGWIIIRDREPVEHVKSLCSPEVAKKITSDNKDSNYSNDYEQDEDSYVTVYTRFFRKDGEVYFEKSTKDVVIHEAIPMNPYLSKKKIKSKEEQTAIVPNQDSNLEENNTIQENTEDLYKFYYYPIETGSLRPREKCIYGISEIEGIVDNQRAINGHISMILMNAQQLGWGKWIVKKGALNGQQITNKPGQILTDYSAPNGWGIKLEQGQQFSNGAFDVANQIIEATRNVTNSSDVITGEMVSKDLSGTAIAQLQAQGQKPIEQMQKRFWRSKERCGKIWEQFYKLYYENTEYSYEISQDEEETREEMMQEVINKNNYKGRIPPIAKMEKGVFNGEDFLKIPFNIVVEAGKGTQYSEIMQMDFANNLILNNAIEKISPENLELLLDMYPDSAMGGMKPDLKKFIRKKQTSLITQLQQQLQQATQLLQEASAELNRRDTKINMLGNYAKGLEQEYGKRLSDSQRQIADMKKFMQNQKSIVNNEEVKA